MTWKTYRNVDGSPIMGEYSFMTEPDYWQEVADDDGYAEVIEETWVLVETRVLKFGSTEVWCAECDEEFDIPEPTRGPHYCEEHTPLPPDPIEVGLALMLERLRAMEDA